MRPGRGYHQPQCRYTQARHRWLALVDRSGDAGMPRLQGTVGFQCMRLGWTQWLQPLSSPSREVLTAAGMQQLQEWNHSHGL